MRLYYDKMFLKLVHGRLQETPQVNLPLTVGCISIMIHFYHQMFIQDIDVWIF